MPLPPSALPGISPSRGEIGKTHCFPSSPTLTVAETLLHPISPLEGEMPGRAEGGKTVGQTL
ncbi:Hypothetical protein RG1141_CH30480 [Neorhizobium galegae bv. officinalis bv. officinalis str. HAMBI 1141]|uniref:Propionyl-coenzyme A carboxylase alpha polypeptide n=1 Tax=Neorhizobium galegae bv. officinalis bv. officinalis str. HAMBI 1141 TaxID=1028801 RepID=A0A068TAD6_NEOGA|nr:Hypothetical protein RG1141_CH30480 [Neorhizobium galegae bv. officinalis bv. officinalis str. HAMBI 1141]